MIDRAILGKTELSVSRLGFGAAPIGFLETEQAQIAELLHYLLDHGVNLIDTAAAYRGSEQAIGKALQGRRDDAIVVTKAGQGADFGVADFDPKAVEASIDRSLERLQTDHVDVVLLHSCDQSVLEQGDALAAAVKAREAGKTRFVGYSGDNEAAAYAAGLPDVAVIETSINVCDQRNIDVVLPVCAAHDVGVIAKRPLANCAWKKPDQQRGGYADYAAPYRERLAKMKVKPNELGYSGHIELEWPEIALKFALAIPGVHTAIAGTTNPHNAETNLHAVEKNPLREQVVERLRSAFTNAQEAADEPWLGLT
ncbi:MAG: aldo/keto reductase [Planctomycetota bacterium]